MRWLKQVLRTQLSAVKPCSCLPNYSITYTLGLFAFKTSVLDPKTFNRSFVSRKRCQAEREKEAESIACLAKQSLRELIEVRSTNAFWGIMSRGVIDLPAPWHTANLKREKASTSFPLFNYVSTPPCVSLPAALPFPKLRYRSPAGCYQGRRRQVRRTKRVESSADK